jgi:hypothetical protein
MSIQGMFTAKMPLVAAIRRMAVRRRADGGYLKYTTMGIRILYSEI